MLLQIADPVPTMVSEVVNEQVEFVDQERPERIIEIDRQTVAVAEHKPRSIRISVTAQYNDGIIVDPNFANRKRLRYFPYGFWSCRQVLALSSRVIVEPPTYSPVEQAANLREPDGLERKRCLQSTIADRTASSAGLGIDVLDKGLDGVHVRTVFRA